MGNNMAIRRAAYDAIGGYPTLPFSITEDFTLVRAIAERTTDCRVRFPLGRPLRSSGRCPPTARRRPTASGGGGRAAGSAADPWVIPLYGLLFGVHALLVAGLLVAPGRALGALAVKTLADGAAPDRQRTARRRARCD